jgi:hypothetical protein
MTDQQHAETSECPFEGCTGEATDQWPGETQIPVLTTVADDLNRQQQAKGAELWACSDHAGLLSAVLGAARMCLDLEAGQAGTG